MAFSSFKDVREFTAYLEKRGLFRRIQTEVSTRYEISHLTARAARLPGGGAALLFEKVRDTKLPVLTNLLGSPQRLAWSLSLNKFEELTDEMVGFLNPLEPQTLGEKLARLGETSYISRYSPRSVRSGVCQEVVETGSDILANLPLLTGWPDEAGAAWRSALIFTEKGVQTGELVITPQGTFIGGEFLEKRDGSVALVSGGSPTLLFAARAPLLPSLDPLVLASSLARQRLDLVRCRTNELEVPATAEIVLEGQLEPVQGLELALVQANGYLAPLPNLCKFTPTALTRRKAAWFVTSVISAPPHENSYLVKGSERLLLPVLKASSPEIRDLTFPVHDGLQRTAVVSIEKSYPGQAQKIMYSLLGIQQLRYLKYVLVVDADCNIHDPAQVMARCSTLVDPGRDILTLSGPLHPFEPLLPETNGGVKLGIDATRKSAAERTSGRVREALPEANIQKLIEEKWLEYGIE